MIRIGTQETIEILKANFNALDSQDLISKDKELILKDFKEALEELEESYSDSSDYHLYIRGLQKAFDLFMDSKDSLIEKLDDFFDDSDSKELRNVMDFIQWEKGTWDIYSYYCEVLHWREMMGEYSSNNPLLELSLSEYLI